MQANIEDYNPAEENLWQKTWKYIAGFGVLLGIFVGVRSLMKRD
ncbi:MAG: hypothetical protein AAGG75_24670 [Bacteroidota bacterium]